MHNLIDDELLISDAMLDQITYRHDANQPPLIEDREVAYASVSHHGHAFLRRLFRQRAHNTRAHNFPNRRGRRVPALEKHFPGVMPLREDSDRPAVLDYHERAYILVSHFLNGVKHGLIWSYGPDLVTFAAKQLPYGSHRPPPACYLSVISMKEPEPASNLLPFPIIFLFL